MKRCLYSNFIAITNYRNKNAFLVGGSADLEPSNVTAGFAEIVKDFTKENTLK